MEWGKLYADLPRSMSLRRAGPLASLLYVFGLCHCIEQERDVIEDEALPLFGLPRVEALARALCREKRWERVSGGYRVHEFFPRQSEAFELAARRRKDADRKKAERIRGQRLDTSKDASTDTSTDSPRNVQGESRGDKNYPPTPRTAGGHDGTHDNCRGCGTNRRGKPEPTPIPERFDPSAACEHGALPGVPCIECRGLRVVSE